jgi:hypothetical protein
MPPRRRTSAPADPDALVRLIMQAVERQQAAVEKLVQRLAAAPVSGADADRAARALASLARTLAALRAVAAGAQAEPDAGHGEFPRSDDELRRELLEKMDALIAGQSAGSSGG